MLASFRSTCGVWMADGLSCIHTPPCDQCIPARCSRLPFQPTIFGAMCHSNRNTATRLWCRWVAAGPCAWALTGDGRFMSWILSWWDVAGNQPGWMSRYRELVKVQQKWALQLYCDAIGWQQGSVLELWRVMGVLGHGFTLSAGAAGANEETSWILFRFRPRMCTDEASLGRGRSSLHVSGS
jgi:hypothetical protein